MAVVWPYSHALNLLNTFLLLKPMCLSQSLDGAMFSLGFHQVELLSLLLILVAAELHVILFPVVDSKVLCASCMRFSWTCVKERVMFHVCDRLVICVGFNFHIHSSSTRVPSRQEKCWQWLNLSCWLHQSYGKYALTFLRDNWGVSMLNYQLQKGQAFKPTPKQNIC